MPHTVHKRGNKWAIVNKDTRKTVGTSNTKTKALISARIRDSNHK